MTLRPYNLITQQVEHLRNLNNLFFPLIKNSWLIYGQFMEIHVKKEPVNVFFIRHEFP